MRIALVDSNPKDIVYPLALLKIGAWRESLGDECKIFKNALPEAGSFDEIWVTTLFTFDIHHAVAMTREATKRADKVKVGGVSASLLPDYFKGTGAEIHNGLIPEAERFSPNYDLLWEKPKYSISHTSRGCIRNCKFCMVTKLEPEFGHRPGWENDLSPETNKVLFFDNNWLAKDRADLEKDVKRLRGLVESGTIKEIDFNQGLDARLVDESMADLLEGIPITPIRFAFDGMHEDGYYQEAIRLLAGRGFKLFRSYVLFNFMDKPRELYYRLRVAVEVQEELQDAGHTVSVESFPMRFQPILEIDTQRSYLGKHWTLQQKKGFRAILSAFTAYGQITCNGNEAMTPMDEFEFWFGSDEEEFIKLISYPKIRQLAQRKKGQMRLYRGNKVTQ